MASFPNTLRGALRDGYQIVPKPSFVRTPMARGASRSRLVSRAPASEVRLQWLFTDAELATFEAWYQLRIAYGTASFDIELRDGMSLAAHAAQFVDSYQVALDGIHWRVSATLELAPRPGLTDDELDAAEGYDPDDLTYANGALAAFGVV